jgi:hypothetical protein
MDTTQYISGAALITKKTLILVLFGFLGLLIFSCTKESDKSHFQVRMTDAPGNYEAVMIDLIGVEVTGSGGGTVTLNTNVGIYNLLDLTNGVNMLIATGDLDAGTVSQIRLILGPNNTVTVDSMVYPLSTPSAMQSGLKLQVHLTFEPGVSYSILVDFDANQSIVKKGNGEYQLKPVIRTIDAAITGSIRGSITPVGLFGTITATSNGVTYSSVTNTTGEFLVAGTFPGTYDVTVTPNTPLLPVTITGVNVTAGVTINIGIIGF